MTGDIKLSAERTPLLMPTPGELELARGFADTEIVEAANRITTTIGQVGIEGFYINGDTPEALAAMRDDSPGSLEVPRELADLTALVVDSLPYEWKNMWAFIRHLGPDPKKRSLKMHNDNDPSLRVIVEGHESRWVFERPDYKKKYPRRGLPLKTGDVVILNNYTDSREGQLKHGVVLSPETDFRTSYLFTFYSRTITEQ